jgi:hypothetical protein
MAVVVYGPVAGEELLATMAWKTPELVQSQKHGSGLFLSCKAAPAVWTAFDGPQGSAIAVWISKPGGSNQFFNMFIEPTDHVPSPLVRDLTFDGRMESQLVEIFKSGDVVPVWETDQFRHIDDGNGFPGLPASIRRAARAWERRGTNWFEKSFQDSEGDNVSVSVNLDSAFGIASAQAPLLVSGLCAFPPERQLDVFADLIQRGPYSVHRMDEIVVLARPVPTNVTPSILDEAARKMREDYVVYFNSHRQGPAT